MTAKRTRSLYFDGGLLTINTEGHGDKDGSGCLIVREDDLEWLTGEDKDFVRLPLPHSEMVALRDHLNEHLSSKPPEPPRFSETFCSSCGRGFGPGDHGYSHCENHAGLTPVTR